LLVFIGAAVISYWCSIDWKGEKEKNNDWWFMAGSLGMVSSFAIIGSISMNATNVTGIDVLALRAAYDYDFSERYDCTGVNGSSKVLLSKMSDDTGYAAALILPDRPLLRIKWIDSDLTQIQQNKIIVTTVHCNQREN